MTTPSTGKTWMRIPDGTRVHLSEGNQEGIVVGLTECVVGSGRNPDGRTQYRIDVGESVRLLVAQDALLVLTDRDGVVLMRKENLEYRQIVTDWMRAQLPTNQFRIEM
jgi:hypothetical protein